MKTTKKITSLLLCLIMILSTFGIMGVSAASANYYVTNASGSKGDTVTVNVKLSGGDSLWGALMSLSYNSSELQYISSNKGNIVANGSLNHSNSKITFAGSLKEGQKSGGTIFTVKFKILKDNGTSNLGLVAGSGKDNCDYDGNVVSVSATGGKVTVSKNVTAVTLDKSNIEMKKGETASLKATVTPSDATNGGVTFTSSNKNVATVNGSGVITAKGGGYATITAKAGGKSAICKVFVPVTQTGIAVCGSADKEVKLFEKLNLKVAKVPSDATDNFPVVWSSSDETIATVSNKGVVNGLAIGTAVITAKCKEWTVTYNITVVENPNVTTTELETTEVETTEYVEITEEVETTEAQSVGGIKGFFNKINNKTVSAFYHYAMVAGVFVITAAISIPVTYFVTAGYYKNMDIKKRTDNLKDYSNKKDGE